jgi:hypothetical protein
MAPKRLGICGLKVSPPRATYMEERTYIAHPINPRNVAPRVFPIVAATAILTDEARQALSKEEERILRKQNVVGVADVKPAFIPRLTEWMTLRNVLHDTVIGGAV